MSYQGNPNLATPVKDRVQTTFNQTVALFRQGRTEEVVAGCNLILQMDPAYEPARKLMEKARNPNAPIDIDSLAPPDNRSLIRQARDAMAARDFQTVIHVTTQILTDDLMNDEARVMGDDAREKMEAAPFVDQFVRKCDQNIATGNLTGARQDLEKARALDPTHPEIIRIAFEIEKRDAAARAAAPSFGSTPFVVDVKPDPPSSRNSAQAADFGFTFEEEKPAGSASNSGFANFSFDSPSTGNDPFGGASFSFDAPKAAPAPQPAPAFDFGAPTPTFGGSGAEFDFSMASVETSAEDQRKIDQYLAEGDRAYDSGDYQQAIDFWSRIFLIDVTNEAASDRIEKAKIRRRELESRVESILIAGVQAFERQDHAAARAKFNEVLEVDRNNAQAIDYLERLDEPAASILMSPSMSSAASAPLIPPSPSQKMELDLFEDEPLPPGFDAPLIPPDPGTAAAPATKKSAPKKASKPGQKKVPVAALAVVLLAMLAGGGWFFWQRFAGGGDQEPAVAASESVLRKATALAKQGKFDEAIATLQEVQPDDPQHDRALEMIADLQQKKSAGAATINGRPAAQYYQEQLDAANTAFQAHDFIAAKKAFEEAMRIKPLPPDMKASYDVASQQAAKLSSAKALFAERKYNDALTNLQALAAQDPENRNVQRMIVDAHFNLGALALQEERVPDALREFDEVLKIDANDEIAQRSRDLAQRYNGEPKDLLYKIYVKYLPLRQPV